jgi:hypothetical protein
MRGATMAARHCHRSADKLAHLFAQPQCLGIDGVRPAPAFACELVPAEVLADVAHD